MSSSRPRRQAPTRSLLLVSAIVLVGLVTGAPPTQASYPGDEGRITLGCSTSLVSMNPDGSDRRTLIDGEAQMHAWSPGGTRIAFLRGGPDGLALWTANADGTNERVVKRIDPRAHASFPTWSPDGRFIAMVVFDGDEGRQRIDILDLDSGTVSVAVSRDPNSRWRPEWTVWSPAGNELAFMLTLDTLRSGLRAVEPDGENMRVLTSPPEDNYDTAPEWSPDAGSFLFGRHSFGALPDSIYVVSAAGGEPVRLTDDTQEALRGAYSPTGGRIAYLAHPPRTSPDPDPLSLWMMGASGEGKELIAHEIGCGEIDWQPLPDFPLVDARFSLFESAIRWAFNKGVATGCSAERFCDRRALTRGQAATLLARTLELPTVTHDYFADDAGTTHEADINRLAESGITTGCAADRYCPAAPVSRAEWASLLARGFALAPATDDFFDDDDGRTHEANINRMAAAGIATGCGDRRFCPSRQVTRGEAVAMLYRAVAD